MMCVLKENIIQKPNLYTMKSIRLLLTLMLFILGSLVYAQNVTLNVSGHVTDQQTGLPIANHQLVVTVFPDSINSFVPIYDSVLTDPSGFYAMNFPVIFTPGTASFFSIGTYDCMMNWNQQVMTYTGNQTSFTADFNICNDTIIPPSPCENYIIAGGIQGLTVSFQGGIMNGQTASYFWDFGDNNSDTGQYITHTYAQQGVYNVVLQTETPYGCIDFSNYTLVLMDSINPSSCENYIAVTGTQGLTVSLAGSLLNGQMADYFWGMGDGTTITGQNITHTYAQQGIYMVTLQTFTSDSCIDVSNYTLVLMDSIPNGCAGYFIASPTSNPYEILFTGYTQSQYPTEFTWEFGDGTTASGQSQLHTYCCFGTYSVTLTTTDSTGCYSSFAAPVVVYPDSTGNMSLGGQVFAGNTPLSQGMVTLFGTDPSGYYYPIQTAYIDLSGSYSFLNVGTGSYIILAFPQPDSLGAGTQYLPTYYGDVIFWEQATPIYLGVPLNPYNINLVSFDSIGGGDGSITGQILGGGKSMLTSGQEVLLLDEFGNTVRIAFTDGQGNFSFTNLPFGEYNVHPVITGVTTQPAAVVLDASSTSATVIMTIEGHTITGISERASAGIIGNVYPNPAIDEISVNIKSQGEITIRIMDASGRVVYTETKMVASAGSQVTILVSHLKPGLYLISVQDRGRNQSSARFMKN